MAAPSRKRDTSQPQQKPAKRSTGSLIVHAIGGSTKLKEGHQPAATKTCKEIHRFLNCSCYRWQHRAERGTSASLLQKPAKRSTGSLIVHAIGGSTKQKEGHQPAATQPCKEINTFLDGTCHRWQHQAERGTPASQPQQNPAKRSTGFLIVHAIGGSTKQKEGHQPASHNKTLQSDQQVS